MKSFTMYENPLVEWRPDEPEVAETKFDLTDLSRFLDSQMNKLKRLKNRKAVNWDDPLYCSCGHEIDKIPPRANIAEFLEKGEIHIECPDCGADIDIELSVRENAITWGQLFYLWDNLGVDIFPAIKCTTYIQEAVA